MRILFLTSSHNELSQRAYKELVEQGHVVAVQSAASDATLLAAAAYFHPQLVIAAFLSKCVPDAILEKYTVLKLHPGQTNDRGPSNRSGALTENWQNWRITVAEATTGATVEGVWASQTYSMPAEMKNESYHRHHFVQAAVQSILSAIQKLEKKTSIPAPGPIINSPLRGRMHNTMLS